MLIKTVSNVNFFFFFFHAYIETISVRRGNSSVQLYFHQLFCYRFILWTCCHHRPQLFLANKSVLCRHIGWVFPAHWALQEMNVPLVTCWSCCSQWEHMATSLTAEGNMLHGHNRICKGHRLFFACCFFICFVIKQMSDRCVNCRGYQSERRKSYCFFIQLQQTSILCSTSSVSVMF